MDESYTRLILDEYSSRAASYDNAVEGWHKKLGKDIATWLSPKPGDYILDLACGTGLVTIPLAQSAGPSGKVIAIDLNPDMIDVGKQKIHELETRNKADDLAEIEWFVQDITSERILNIPTIKHILDTRGGFDAISLCSALVLLPHQKDALVFWVSTLLRKGGKIIVDVPTEDLTIQFILSYHLPLSIGHKPHLSEGRQWIKDDQSLAELFHEVGLDADETFRTKSYLGETWYDGDQQTARKVFNDMVEAGKTSLLQQLSGKMMEHARDTWSDLWMRGLTKKEDGNLGFRDGRWLYVCVGRKL